MQVIALHVFILQIYHHNYYIEHSVFKVYQLCSFKKAVHYLYAYFFYSLLIYFMYHSYLISHGHFASVWKINSQFIMLLFKLPSAPVIWNALIWFLKFLQEMFINSVGYTGLILLKNMFQTFEFIAIICDC